MRTSGEIQTEITALQKELAEVKNREKEEYAERQFSYIDSYLAVVTEHGRTTCSDVMPINGNGKCNRCTLLEFRRDGFWPVGFVVSINVFRKDER